MKKKKELASTLVVHQNLKGTQDFPPDHPLRISACNVPLRVMLDYLSDTGGFMVEVKPNVDVNIKVNGKRSQPLNIDEALGLLEQALYKHSCTLIQNGLQLVVMRTEDAKKTYIPIRLTARYQGMLDGSSSFRPRNPSSFSICSN